MAELNEAKPPEPKPHDLGKVKFNVGVGRKPEPEKKDSDKQ